MCSVNSLLGKAGHKLSLSCPQQMFFCCGGGGFISKSPPGGIQRDVFLETAKQTAGCATEGEPHLSPSAVSPRPRINLPVTEQRQASGPPPKQPMFSASFPTQGHSLRSQPPQGPPASRDPCPFSHGGSPLSDLPSNHQHTRSPFRFGEVKVLSSHITLPTACCFPSFLGFFSPL